ncbi:unnamed protein product, partial [Polarella glacialis]
MQQPELHKTVAVLGVCLEKLVTEEYESLPTQESLAEHSTALESVLGTATRFWRSSRLDSEKELNRMGAVTCGPGSLDYFVSHVWQPSAEQESLDVNTFSKKKVDTIRQWGVSEAAIAGAGTGLPRPWCLFADDEQKDDPVEDPKDAWRTWKCWVDKACSGVPSSQNIDGIQNPMRILRSTKAALTSCDKFLALISNSSFFSRLWCTFEWSYFLAHAAPHYRRLELLISDDLLEPEAWQKIVDAAAKFSLASLRTACEGDHPELWQELEQLFISDTAFEKFMQITSLSLLALHALLACSRLGAAFRNAKLLEAIRQACIEHGVPGLAKALRHARPEVWLRTALKQSKDFEGTDDADMEALEVDIRERRPSILIDENDPLERLARLIEGRKSKNQAEEQKEGADEVGEDGQPRPECTAGQAAGYAMASEVEEKASRKPVQEGFDSRPSISSSQPGVDESRTQARRTSHSSRPGTGDTATGKDNFRPKRASGMPSEIREMRDSASSGWQQAAAVSMSGLPDGFASFWRAVKGGKELSASERQRSRIFYRAWGLYRRRVEKWFDYAVSPHLEVWRQRGIRSRGV